MSKDENWPERLVKLRKSYGWTQRELAKEFMVSHAAVGHWESGAREMLGPVKKLIEIYEKDLKKKKVKLNRI